MQRILLIAITFLISQAALAQQDPLYSLYLNNPMVINPAYTGINNNLMAAINYRNQWAAFDGNPTTMAASGHLSLRDNKMGAGLLIISDKIGEVTNTSFSGSYSYKIIKDEYAFSFGMQAGLINYKTDPSDLSLQNPDDPAFAAVQETKFNLGAGVMMKSEKYIIGFSVPRMISNSLTTQGGSVKVYQQHFYFFGGYAYYLSDRILLKPSVLLKGVKGAPASVDVNFNIDINRNYTAGIFTRNFQAFGLQAQFNFKEKYRLGYVFELPSNASVGTRFTTHEIMLSLRTAVFDFHNRSTSVF